jgi:hypothetical protein
MKRKVVVDFYPEVYRFFERHGCANGFPLIYYSAGICKYHLQNYQLEAEVRCYMSSQLKQPVLNINILEFMDEATKRSTVRLLEPLIYAGMGELGQEPDFQCIMRKGIKITIIFSFFNTIFK